MVLTIELSESEIRNILADHINKVFNTELTGTSLPIEVKSRQNYNSEWELAHIRISTKVIK